MLFLKFFLFSGFEKIAQFHSLRTSSCDYVEYKASNGTFFDVYIPMGYIGRRKKSIVMKNLSWKNLCKTGYTLAYCHWIAYSFV